MFDEAAAREGCDYNSPFSYSIGRVLSGRMSAMMGRWFLAIFKGSKLLKNRWLDDAKTAIFVNFSTQLRVKSRFFCDDIFILTPLFLMGFFAVKTVIPHQAA